MMERLVIPLVVVTICVSVVSDALPRIGPWLVVLAVLAALLRIVWHLSRWH